MEALKMESQMDNCNDDRLDELSRRVDDGFARVEQEMKDGFAKVDRGVKEGFAEVDKRFDKVEQRFERLMHAMMVAGISFGITAFASLSGFVLTQV